MKQFKEILRTDKQYFICPFCNREFRALARHTSHVHSITGKELRKKFNLKSNYQLITNDIKAVCRENVFKNSHVIKSNLIDKGKTTQYKKGDIGHIKENWSNQAIHELSKRGKTKKNLKNLKYINEVKK